MAKPPLPFPPVLLEGPQSAGAPWGHAATIHTHILTSINLFRLPVLNISGLRSSCGCKVTALPTSLHPQLSCVRTVLTQGNHCCFVTLPPPSTPPLLFFRLQPRTTSVSCELISVESPRALVLGAKPRTSACRVEMPWDVGVWGPEPQHGEMVKERVKVKRYRGGVKPQRLPGLSRTDL